MTKHIEDIPEEELLKKAKINYTTDNVVWAKFHFIKNYLGFETREDTLDYLIGKEYEYIAGIQNGKESKNKIEVSQDR